MASLAKRKLNSDSGASIVLAIVVFMILAIISMVIVNTAVTSAMRLNKARAEEQAYLTVTSAAEQVIPLLRDQTVTVSENVTEHYAVDAKTKVATLTSVETVDAGSYVVSAPVGQTPTGLDTFMSNMAKAAVMGSDQSKYNGNISSLGGINGSGPTMTVIVDNENFKDVSATVSSDYVPTTSNDDKVADFTVTMKIADPAEADKADYQLKIKGTASVGEDSSRYSVEKTMTTAGYDLTKVRYFNVNWSGFQVSPIKTDKQTGGGGSGSSSGTGGI